VINQPPLAPKDAQSLLDPYPEDLYNIEKAYRDFMLQVRVLVRG
jgi:hypothetical protein